MKPLLFLVACALLCSCATPQLAEPKEGLPGMEVVKGSGYAFTASRHDYMVQHGADAHLFYPWNDPAHPFFISSDNEPIVAQEMLAFRNPKAKK